MDAIKQSGHSSGHAGPDGPEDPGRHGVLHGYGLARRIEQLSEDAMQVSQGTIYLCLVRLVQKGWINAKWGTSENNRSRVEVLREAG